MTSIELNEDVCVDLLKKYIDIGYKNTGVVTIKEGAVIHKYFRILKKAEKTTDMSVENIYKVIFRVLEVLNSSKAYTLDDASVIDMVIGYINDNVLSKKQETNVEEKIKEV